PALGGEATTVGRPAMRRLAGSVAVEAACVLAILGVVTALGVSPPARHEQPDWPLSFRLALGALGDTPDAWPFVLVGSQIAVLGVVVVLCSLALRAARWPLLAGGGVLVLAGFAMAVPPFATDAYPTTYQRPAVPYEAASVAAGAALYARDCATCHGASGAGDGPAARAFSPPPPDLRAHHAALHTAGDLYWWITHGRRAMPAFGHLEPDARWSLVNYVRALGAAEAPRRRAAHFLSGRHRRRARDRESVRTLRARAARRIPGRPAGLPARARGGAARDRAPARQRPGAERGKSRRRAAGRARALMAVWKVVVLLDLALALGVGGGYLWWGRQADRLARELAEARTAAAGPREFHAEGVIRAV